jgi:hypothetical protein
MPIRPASSSSFTLGRLQPHANRQIIQCGTWFIAGQFGQSDVLLIVIKSLWFRVGLG